MSKTGKTFKLPTDLSVMIIAGDPKVAAQFRLTLESAGVSICEIFCSGRLALECANHRSYDLVYVLSEPSDMALVTVIRSLRSGTNPMLGPIKMLANEQVHFSKEETSFFKEYSVDILKFKATNQRRIIADVVRYSCEVKEPTSLQKRIEEGKKLVQQGLLNEAEKFFLELEREDKSLLPKVGLLRSAEDNSQLYWKKVKELVASDPKNYNFQFEMIDRYMEEGRSQEASRLLDSVLTEVEKDPELYWMTELGMVCLGLRFYTHCFRIAKKIRARDGDECWRADLLLARTHFAIGDVTESQKSLTRAVLAMPNPSAESENLLAIHARHNGNFEKALDHYRMALSITANDYRIHFNIGLCLELLNKPEEAQDHYRKAIDIYPDYTKALAKLTGKS